MSTTVDPFAAINATGTASAPKTSNEAGSADRFLKLLVTQMQNQDPLNPMDNAQVTSQMAQINTVNGIETLNTTVSALNAQFVQMQALQGAALVGHDVTVKGNTLAIEDGVGVGAFDLEGAADVVKVEVLDASGRVVDTLQLGAETTGRHEFEWPGAATAAAGTYTFRVTATSGSATVATTALMRDRVEAVSTVDNTLTLELERSGSVAYADVKAFN
jgi:flagellar basal-body rod modification protein FlgD